MPKGPTEREYQLAFEEFLDTIGDVMQLYYANDLSWPRALQWIEVAAREMRQRQGRALADFLKEGIVELSE